MEDLRNHESAPGRWHGTNIRGPMFVSYSRATASEDIHPPEFEAVKNRLEELSRAEDGNHQPIVKFIFTRTEHHHPVIAYQWTSEWADCTYSRELVMLGPSLARGMWSVFGSDPAARYDFDMYVR